MITIISSEDNAAGLEELGRLSGSSGIDRPENGLHPIHHADLAEEWMECYNRGEDVFVFTHSEIAMLRLLRRIQEGMMLPAHVRFLVYATQLEEPRFVEVPLVMDGQGEVDFRDHWPCESGFFKCRGDELFY